MGALLLLPFTPLFSLAWPVLPAVASSPRDGSGGGAYAELLPQLVTPRRKAGRLHALPTSARAVSCPVPPPLFPSSSLRAASEPPALGCRPASKEQFAAFSESTRSPPDTHKLFPLTSKHLVCFSIITQQSRCWESLLASAFSLRAAMSFLPPLSLCQLLLMELTSLLLQTLHPSPPAHTSVSKRTVSLRKVHSKLEDDYTVCTGAGEYINPVGYFHCLCLS